MELFSSSSNTCASSASSAPPECVKTQVWIAVAVYVLVAIVRKRLNLELSLHEMLQILSITPFEKIQTFSVSGAALPVRLYAVVGP